MEGENKTRGVFCGSMMAVAHDPRVSISSALEVQDGQTQSGRPRAVQGSKDSGVGLGHGRL